MRKISPETKLWKWVLKQYIRDLYIFVRNKYPKVHMSDSTIYHYYIITPQGDWFHETKTCKEICNMADVEYDFFLRLVKLTITTDFKFPKSLFD